MDELTEGKIKSLLLKGFNKEEISRMLNINKEDIIVTKEEDIIKESSNLYSELQKDLSKVVLQELNKTNVDSGTVLNAIKLQAELQEKKLLLERKNTGSKISKDYLYDRDEEIYKLLKEGLSEDKIAKKYNISVLSVRQAIDRYNLNLPEEIKTLSPSIISETIGLGKKERLKILTEAYNNNLKRNDVREIVNNIKNNKRKHFEK